MTHIRQQSHFTSVSLENCQISEVKILSKIITGLNNKMFFIKYFISRCLKGIWLRYGFGIFTIFIIKPSPINANNNPNLETFILKSKEASEQKTCIVSRSTFAELHDRNIALTFIKTKRQGMDNLTRYWIWF